mmetsp:Transcript_29717/g.98485  ORF Transcript_29717/g.98485 Transcript_29717/m.98485 type:complete len:297 (-) Transcript_29717:104-994(-)
MVEARILFVLLAAFCLKILLRPPIDSAWRETAVRQPRGEAAETVSASQLVPCPHMVSQSVSRRVLNHALHGGRLTALPDKSTLLVGCHRRRLSELHDLSKASHLDSKPSPGLGRRTAAAAAAGAGNTAPHPLARRWWELPCLRHWQLRPWQDRLAIAVPILAEGHGKADRRVEGQVLAVEQGVTEVPQHRHASSQRLQHCILHLLLLVGVLVLKGQYASSPDDRRDDVLGPPGDEAQSGAELAQRAVQVEQGLGEEQRTMASRARVLSVGALGKVARVDEIQSDQYVNSANLSVLE